MKIFQDPRYTFPAGRCVLPLSPGLRKEFRQSMGGRGARLKTDSLRYFIKIGMPSIGQIVRIMMARKTNKAILNPTPCLKNSPVENSFDS